MREKEEKIILKKWKCLKRRKIKSERKNEDIGNEIKKDYEDIIDQMLMQIDVKEGIVNKK